MTELNTLDRLNGLRSEDAASTSNSSPLMNQVDFLQLFKRNITIGIAVLFKYQGIISEAHGNLFYTSNCQIPHILLHEGTFAVLYILELVLF